MWVEIGEIERARFVEFLRAVSLAGELENAVVRFGENEITATNMEPGATILSDCWFSTEIFKNYSVDQEITVSIPSSLIDLLKKLKTVDTIVLEVTENTVSIWRGDKKLKIVEMEQKAILNESDIPSYGLKIKKTNFGKILYRQEEDPDEVASQYSYAQISLKTGREVNPLKLDYVEFVVRNGMLVFTQISEGGTVKVSDVIAMDVRNAIEGNNVRVSTNLFKIGVESMIVKEFTLAIAKDRPLVLNDTSSLWDINVLIAPVIKE